MQQVQLGGDVVDVDVPASVSIRTEILAAASASWRRAAAAALGACWRGRRRPAVRYDRCEYNPLMYGGMVCDELVGRGLALEDVYAAGLKCLELIRDKDRPTEPEVAAAEVFSDPVEEGSTG